MAMIDPVAKHLVNVVNEALELLTDDIQIDDARVDDRFDFPENEYVDAVRALNDMRDQLTNREGWTVRVVPQRSSRDGR